jgi:hypothetical protein
MVRSVFQFYMLNSTNALSAYPLRDWVCNFHYEYYEVVMGQRLQGSSSDRPVAWCGEIQ